MKFSKSHQKLIKSLSQKKYRQRHNLFIAEGIKVVNELLNSAIKVEMIYTTNTDLFRTEEDKICEISETDLKKISNLKSPNTVLALFKIERENTLEYNDFSVVLDGINDPGNLGTIIRLCDWFGVSQIVCSPDTVDCFNQKVVQSTMGSLARVSVVYADLSEFIKKTKLPIYVTDMDGENIYKTELPKKAVVVMGNEANGVSDNLMNTIANKLSIPRFGNLKETESLNVATATGIFLSEFKRNS